MVISHLLLVKHVRSDQTGLNAPAAANQNEFLRDETHEHARRGNPRFAARSAYERSSGQQQRIALARACVFLRRVLLSAQPLSKRERQAARVCWAGCRNRVDGLPRFRLFR
jgi:ABC-type lipoprotein export system ATPase subunit